jgi:peptidoglycan/LPS O-acetylase OafA/YrhL
MGCWTLAAVLISSTAPIVALTVGAYIVAEQRDMSGRKVPPSPERTGAPTKFARDVVMNVAANLIAAAIIYLLVALAGLLPKSPTLLLTAAVVIAIPGGVILFLAGVAAKGKSQVFLFGSSMILLGIVGLVIPFVPGSDLSGLEKVLMPVGAIGCLIIGIVTVTRGRSADHS